MEKSIEVFDDVFRYHDRQYFYDFFVKSRYKIGWEDSTAIENLNFKNLHSSFTEEDVANLNIINRCFINSSLAGFFSTHSLGTSVVNLVTPTNVHFSHVHPKSDKVFLYYANLKWSEEWGGETLFFSENLKNIIFASPYTPGRIIIFDGNIPHTIRPQTINGPAYRFTFTMFFNKL